jgi:hypothetical protein
MGGKPLPLTALALALLTLSAITPSVQPAALKSKSSGFTLDPETLRQVHEILRSTSEASTKDSDKNVGTIVFEDSELDNIVATRNNRKR